MRNCIVVLTRGYDDIAMYDKLIRRNKAIQKNLIDNTIDILIFHEGNIKPEHQMYIYCKTPYLNIRFVDVNNGIAFKTEKNTIEFHPGTALFGIGYRHMCSFWFVDFWGFLSDYDRMLRIDEDCYIDFNIDVVLKNLDTNDFICGKWIDDHEFVTLGLNAISLECLDLEASLTKSPSGPYTNVFAINLQRVRANQLLRKYIKTVEDSGNIYRYRWGDLPLWGEAIHYIFGMKSVLIDTGIRYVHESHFTNVNF
jgi:hypothetical protein